MFSSRLPWDRPENALAAIEQARREAGRDIVDLTESNPTRAHFDYPDDLLQPLADRRGLVYAPQPLGLPEARCAVVQEYARHGVAVDPGRIALTASTKLSVSK